MMGDAFKELMNLLIGILVIVGVPIAVGTMLLIGARLYDYFWPR